MSYPFDKVAAIGYVNFKAKRRFANNRLMQLHDCIDEAALAYGPIPTTIPQAFRLITNSYYGSDYILLLINRFPAEMLELGNRLLSEVQAADVECGIITAQPGTSIYLDVETGKFTVEND